LLLIIYYINNSYGNRNFDGTEIAKSIVNPLVSSIRNADHSNFLSSGNHSQSIHNCDHRIFLIREIILNCDAILSQFRLVEWRFKQYLKCFYSDYIFGWVRRRVDLFVEGKTKKRQCLEE